MDVTQLTQSRSQSFVPLDQRSENESSGSIHFEITMANNRILVIRLTAQSQSASMACYGACLKWMLPGLSFSDRWSRGTKLWERDCNLRWIMMGWQVNVPANLISTKAEWTHVNASTRQHWQNGDAGRHKFSTCESVWRGRKESCSWDVLGKSERIEFCN